MQARTKHRHTLLDLEEPLDPTCLRWPDGASLALCLTFECWTSGGAGLQIIGTTVDYGMRRGVWNVLDLLQRHGVPATFFVDGPTALDHPEPLRAMVADGHEVAVLGDAARPQWNLPAEEERRFIAEGRAAVSGVIGTEPAGWRSAQGRTSRHTLELIAEAGFSWDSSLCNDDHPYPVRTSHGTLIEVPFNGAADYRHYSTFPGPMMLPPAVESVWLDELQVAAVESRVASTTAVFTFNPSYTGRPGELGVLDTVLRTAAGTDGIWIAPAGAVAAWVSQHADVPSSQEIA